MAGSRRFPLWDVAPPSCQHPTWGVFRWSATPQISQLPCNGVDMGKPMPLAAFDRQVWNQLLFIRTGCLLLPSCENKDSTEGFSRWHSWFSLYLFSKSLLWLVEGRRCASNVTCEAFAVVGMNRIHTVEGLSSENQATRPGNEILSWYSKYTQRCLIISIHLRYASSIWIENCYYFVIVH